MSFLTRLGVGLLIFSLVAFVSQLFGYAPRKLAHLQPAQIRAASYVIAGFGAVFLACGANPRARKYLFITLGSLLGLGVLAVAAALIIGHFSSRPKQMPPGPPPSASWNNPAAPAQPMPPSASSPSHGAPPAPTSPAATMHEKRRQWTERFGREKVWSIVVHLRGKPVPEKFESVLVAASGDTVQGGAAVSNLGGLIEAVVAPSDETSVQKALTALFPGSDIRVTAATRHAVVFVR